MGFTGTIVAAKAPPEVDIERVLAGFDFHEPETVEDGWVIDEGHRHPAQAADYFLDLVEAVSGPVLLAEVAHSDLAYVIVATPATDPVTVILTPRAFRAEGMPVPRGCARRADMDAFVAWTIAAPRRARRDRLEAMIKAGNTFAEDLVWELLDELRIRPLPDSEVTPSPDEAEIARVGAVDLVGYLKPMSWMGERRSATRDVPWREHRFVPGHGEDFCGIWDRKAPGGPLLTYANDLRGREALWMDLVDLDARLELGDASDAFDGMIGLLGDLQGFYPGGRAYRVFDSRFIPGWGAGFAGVWDREVDSQPVVKFKGGQSARDRALSWANQAMLKILAAAKTIGPDRWISRSREDPPYDHQPASDSNVWLLAYEDADPTWSPHGLLGEEANGFVLHAVIKLRQGFDIHAFPVMPSMDPAQAKEHAHGYGAGADWLRVPDEVPRNLLETARRVVEDSPLAASLVPSPYR